ncbi:hypothetical protein [Roseomonas sp. BN140053]|uniref:hypothetical protein n=1 Tax=Roseomonas sp. BN140053 TaxID=3391898 RepID=UPI0039E8F3C7
MVKAVPRPSKTYGETVCCAGVTGSGEWRRIFPVRFRQLASAQQFARWQWVRYSWRRPVGDNRIESRRVEENTLKTVRRHPEADRWRVLSPLLRASTRDAAERRESLALIEPRDLRLRAKPKTPSFLAEERARYQAAARQHGMFDRTVAEIEPCPYSVAIAFTDHDGEKHTPQCGDWETTAAFFNLRRSMTDPDIIRHLESTYTQPRPGSRILLAMGTVKSRPRQWLLLGVLRVRDPAPGQFQLGL